MDDAQAGARLVGLSRMPRQTTDAAAPDTSGLSGSATDARDATFEADLQNWLAELYAVRAERRLMRQLERLYGAGWLAVSAATLAVAVLGAGATIAALLLLLAMLVAAWRAAWSDSGKCLWPPKRQGHHSSAASDWPALGAEERALLVRLMNLSRAAWRPATRMLLRAEWRQARSGGPLAGWGALDDLEDVVLSNPFATSTKSH
jgi:hypothetical protein